MKLTSKGRYALCAMADLANNSTGNAVRLQDISTRQGISLHYLEQLFRRLRNGGCVRSIRGPGGGYVLAREANNITVEEILSSVGESVAFSNQVKVKEEATTEANTVAKYFTQVLDTVVSRIITTDTLETLSTLTFEAASVE